MPPKAKAKEAGGASVVLYRMNLRDLGCERSRGAEAGMSAIPQGNGTSLTVPTAPR